MSANKNKSFWNIQWKINYHYSEVKGKKKNIFLFFCFLHGIWFRRCVWNGTLVNVQSLYYARAQAVHDLKYHHPTATTPPPISATLARQRKCPSASRLSCCILESKADYSPGKGLKCTVCKVSARVIEKRVYVRWCVCMWIWLKLKGMHVNNFCVNDLFPTLTRSHKCNTYPFETST